MTPHKQSAVVGRQTAPRLAERHRDDLAEAFVPSGESAHGNPCIVLPSRHPAGCVEVLDAEAQVVWRSHGAPPDATHVSADVWDGVFCGSAEGWAVLEAGDYRVRWRGDDASDHALGRLKVRARTVMDDTLGDLGRIEDLESGGWQVRGGWCLCPDGLRSDGGPAHLFRTGAMHGRLEAVFHCMGSDGRDGAWGLIARHYNAANHLRVFVRPEGGRWRIGLARYPGDAAVPGSSAVLAQAERKAAPGAPVRLTWALNGVLHRVYLDDDLLFEVCDGYMGGVEIVGLFSACDGVAWSRARMTTTQHVPAHHVERPAYSARIRPGNVDVLRLRRSAAPRQNVCWESGIQFGHIGGSEIKFTQGAKLRVVEAGRVVTTVAWCGPMPKFVEQSGDVRGWAHGAARFYDDTIVVDDRVLAWADRSVGPDLDILSTLIDGSVRVCASGDEQFDDWKAPSDGRLGAWGDASHAIRFPVAVAVPLRLGGERWWLTLLCILRYPQPDTAPARLFAWHCPHALTASYDMRVAPTEPGREYGYTHVVRWERSDSPEPVERNLLALRADWMQPMRIEPVLGAPVTFDRRVEQPREALDFTGCFDSGAGCYVYRAAEGRFAFRMDPGGLPRSAVVVAIRDWPSPEPAVCRLDGQPLAPGRDVAVQVSASKELVLRLLRPVTQPVLLEGLLP